MHDHDAGRNKFSLELDFGSEAENDRTLRAASDVCVVVDDGLLPLDTRSYDSFSDHETAIQQAHPFDLLMPDSRVAFSASVTAGCGARKFSRVTGTKGGESSGN